VSVDVRANSGIAELVLNHPPVNAFDSKGWAQLAATIAAVGKEPDTRVVVIAAEGRGF
jgi:enoyl-CoA hydratase